MSKIISKTLLENSKGEARKVGFEIEYIDYSLSNSVHLIRQLFGGNIAQENDHVIYIDNTPYGQFKVERDLNLLQVLSDKSSDNKTGGKIDIEGIANDILTFALKDVIPIEIVTPPMPLDKIIEVDLIIDALKKTTANDTSKNIFSAFGLHINPELRSFDSGSILNYLRAYCLLNCWLRNEIDVDISRNISPFIDEYPAAYVTLILDEYYNPDLKSLIDDYIKYNNTRNRSLDMLPVFKYLNENQVSKLLPKEAINPRPTFHYRLPNTSFRRENWSVSKEWNRWLMVEKVANNDLLVNDMSKKYMSLHEKEIIFNKEKWVKETACYLEKIEA